jgi:L-methionine (R)-S-oxide reductase
VVFGVDRALPSAALVPSLPPAIARLHRLQCAVEALAAAIGAEWVGVYRCVASPPAARPTAAGERALVKEAYVGSPSRPFFPLTAPFASGSNNSTVAMTGGCVVIHDVRRMPADSPYYICDGKVRTEICAPIWAGGVPRAGRPTVSDGDAGEAEGVIGIIDAEAWRPDHFTPERIAAVLQACRQLGEVGLWASELPV